MAIMNKVVPDARKPYRLCCLVALALALQIPAVAFAAKSTEGDGYEMRVRIKTLTSSPLRVGDSFTAICVDPGRFSGATIVVRIQSIAKSGHFKGATEMNFSFDHIRLQNGESYPISADIVRLYDTRSGEQVDAEGEIETRRQHRPRTLKRTGIGALVGGIFGPGQGAAIDRPEWRFGGQTTGPGSGCGIVDSCLSPLPVAASGCMITSKIQIVMSSVSYCVRKGISVDRFPTGTTKL